MARRILIASEPAFGVKISPAGEDVLGAGRKVLDSDFTCLKVHHHQTLTVSGDYDNNFNFYLYSIPTVSFDELPYLPLVFVFCARGDGQFTTYPPGTGYVPNGTTEINMRYMVTRSQVSFPAASGLAAPAGYVPTIRIHVIVFRNEVEI